MYTLNEQQIDRILNDIRARGVKTESLQLNLLDHICCIVEQNLEPDGDFEDFYARTIKTFYIKELGEIEEEAQLLLTYKNYYAMKKIMITSGIISALCISIGILFKFMQWPGAAAGIVLGVSTFSLVFLPLVFLLKAKENKALRDRVIYALGIAPGILLSLAILFKIMYWPGANVMGLTALILTGAVFLPVYFFNGIRHAESKLNTMVTSILIVAGCGLFMSLMRIPATGHKQSVADTAFFVHNQQILQTELSQLQHDANTTNVFTTPQSAAINHLCEAVKQYLVQRETGKAHIPANFNQTTDLLSEGRISKHIEPDMDPYSDIEALRTHITQYNATVAGSKLKEIPYDSNTFADRNVRITTMLNDLVQIQMVLVQNEREQLSRVQ
jgi:multisubunit Na+/H+ antiporter MnhB subunit